MNFTKDFNVFVGGITGTFKGLKVTAETCVAKNLQSLSAITADHEISSISWGDDDEREILLGCGSKGIRSVKIYDTERSSFASSFNCDIGKGKIRGISRYDDAVITAVESGDIKLWRFDESEQISINAGKDLRRMRHSKVNKNLIATGGQENELKLFDLEKKVQIFTAKNVPHDMLQLRMPVWISDICFLPNSSLVVTAGKYGHVRLYDPRSKQRRPVINLQKKDAALSCISCAQKDKHVVVGSGCGRMNLIDLRSPGKILNTYKGFTGGITDLSCSNSEPLIASVSLDRYFRIHRLETKELIKKVYLVGSLNAMLLRSNFSLKPEDEENTEISVADGSLEVDDELQENPDSEAEYDEIFGDMPIIANDVNEADFIENKKRRPSKAATVIDTVTESLDQDEEFKSVSTKKVRKKIKYR